MKTLGKGANDALETFLTKFERYYNVQKSGAPAPFDALAEFHSQTQQYFLVKSARIADIESNEYVFFSSQNELTAERLVQLDKEAWSQGLARVRPHGGHKNSDITLIALADTVSDDAKKLAKKLKHYKSYKFGLCGWSGYRSLVYETSSGTCVTNRLGKNLRALANSI